MLKFIRVTNATLTLLEDIIIKNCHEKRTTIDLFFTTDVLIKKLIECKINQSIKNSFNHLFIETCLKLYFVEKSMRCSRRDWKSMNLEKFEQYLETHLLESLSKEKSERQRINEYIESLLRNIEKTIKNFTSWAKICNRSREFWSKKCKQIIKKRRRKRRVYIKNSTIYNWTKYMYVCDTKDKIIKRHKRDDY